LTTLDTAKNGTGYLTGSRSNSL